MKRQWVKKLIVSVMTVALGVGCFTGCGTNDADTAKDNTANEDTTKVDEGTSGDEIKEGGTILWLSNISSGLGYDNMVKYSEMICEDLGYKFSVIYGDTYNDPAGNLTAVKNGMTKDVVALITSQDGGIQNIMDEYPELYVCGYNTDLAAVFSEGGPATAVREYEKFLGTICDGFASGVEAGKEYAQTVIEKGYEKISLVTFPAYAYPQLEVSAEVFREEIATYNETATKKVEIIGDTKVLEFMPLDESYFLEDGHGDLDAIIGMCSGTEFVYPTMKSAIGAGTCSSDTKLITGGFNDDEGIIADIGGEGIIQYIGYSPAENGLFPFVLIDNALTGQQYADFDKTKPVDSLRYRIASKEDVDNVMTKSFNGTGDISKIQLPWEDSKALFTRYNKAATYADLLSALHSEELSVKALANK